MISAERGRGIALALGAAAISGVSVFLNGFAVREFGDATLYTTFKNLLAAGILIAGAAVVTRRSSVPPALPRTARDRLGLVAIGVVGGGLPFYLFFQGLALTSPASAAFIHKTLVIWVALLAVTFLRERFTRLHAAAIAVLILGQIAASGGVGPLALDTGGAMVLAATLLWSVEVVVAKPLLARLAPATVAAGRLGIGVVVLGAIAVATGAYNELGSVSQTAWVWVLITGVVLSGYVATWYAALARAQAIDVTAVLVFGAVITAVLGGAIRGTDLTAGAAGLALITLGSLAIALVAMRRTPQLATR